MPTYEYRCDACGNQFEKFQSITAEPIKKCPKCGKNKVRRLISSGAGVIFKGSGFYTTDYRDSSYKDKAKAETGGGAETKTEAEKTPAADTAAKTESQPAPAAESKPKSEPKKTPTKKK